jgi:hypothetical protein
VLKPPPFLVDTTAQLLKLLPPQSAATVHFKKQTAVAGAREGDETACAKRRAILRIFAQLADRSSDGHPAVSWAH